jgi:hypothetical protein
MKIRPLLFTLLRACPIFGYFWNNYAAFVFVGPHQRIRRRVRRFVLA